MAPDDGRRKKLEEFAHRARLTAHAPALDAAGLAASEALASAGIDALLLKGPALAQMLYLPEEHAGYFDIDLLIARRDRAVASAILAKLGYANLTEPYGADEMAGNLHAHHWTRFDSEVGNISIDLHWQLPGCQAAAEVIWAVLSRHRVTIQLAGGRAAALDRAGLALHLALHAAQHGPGDLKALGDLGRGLGRWPSETWTQAARLARELQALESFAAGLRLLPAGAVRADELGLPQAAAGLWAIAHRDERPRGVFHLTAFSEAATTRGRIDVLRRALLPQRAWIEREHGWAASRRHLWVIAYATHLLRAPAWAVRAWRFRRRAPR